MRRSQPPADSGADPTMRPVGSLTHRPLAARNPRIARLARLARQRSARATERAFVVEGPKLIGEALDAGWPLEAVFVETVGLPRPAVAEVLARCTDAGLPAWQVVAGALARAADASTSLSARARPLRTPTSVTTRTDVMTSRRWSCSVTT